MQTIPEETTLPVLCFTLCEQYYALSINDVLEVAAMVETAKLGIDVNPAIQGVIIRHGEPLILIDLRVLFHCPDAPINLSTLFIVVQYGNELVGFIVDSVQGVVYFQKDAIRPVSGENGYVYGVLTHDNTLIQWLNLSTILNNTLPANVETD